MVEFERTIPTLWNHVRGPSWYHPFEINESRLCSPDFVGLYPEYIAEGNALEFISDDGGESYNLCHCEDLFRPPFDRLWLTSLVAYSLE